MSDSWYKDLDDLFDAALQIADEDERKEFVDRSCDDNEELRAELHALLEADKQPDIGLLGTDPAVGFLGAEEKAGPRADLVDRTLGDFVVRDKLEEGGFGEVYRAEQPALGREAVIKVLRSQHSGDRDSAQRFLREARLASQLDHPYAAHIYAFGVEPDGLQWIAMELVRGTTLREIIATQGRIALHRLVPLVERICEVVHTAHEQGIVHRDIKPENVMILSRAGRLLPKLLDLGIARTVQEQRDPARDVAATPDREIAVRELSPVQLTATVGRLTGHGRVMGSPLYMAPEQWRDAASAGRRADQYAVAAVTYEALTGEPPFSGKSLPELEKAHCSQALPTLAGEFPDELDAALHRAMAKNPSDRYDSVLDLASGFRAASGLPVETSPIPRIDDALRAAIVSGAPQPIAEAVSALEAAGNVYQAGAAMWAMVDVVAHYLGLVALACRSRFGPGFGPNLTTGAERDSATVVDSIRQLHRGELDSPAWIALIRELTRRFEGKPAAYPIPELVTLVHPWSDGSDRDELFQGLWDGRGEFERCRTGSPVQVSEHVTRWLPAVERFLTAVAFVSDYTLVVNRADVVEQWMGVRGARRSILRAGPRTEEAVRTVSDASQLEGRPLLIDRDGGPVVSLWPLMQVARPVSEGPHELFLLTGKGWMGARLVAMPREFEHHDEMMWRWFADNLLDGGERDGGERDGGERAPYRGLHAFTADDAEYFFGREEDTARFLNRLRQTALLGVVGPSGAGKSSFVRAGVIPALGPGWTPIIARPGAQPITALLAQLGHVGVDCDGLLEALQAEAESPMTLGQRLRDVAHDRDTSVLLVIDQLEELFTLGAGSDDVELYAQALGQAARSPDDRVRVVVTLRDDFLIQAAQLPGFRHRLIHGLHLLTTPAFEDLERILELPAERVGFTFDDAALPREMIAEVQDHPAALAMLSFAAARLWDGRDRHFHQLLRTSYDVMGGVVGALAQHAETTLARQPVEHRPVVREVFRHLVTSSGTRARLSRSELAEVVASSHTATVIEAWIAARVLMASDTESGQDCVEIVHEALLDAWPRLVEWRREDAQGARMRDQLRQATRQWVANGRPRGQLWRGDILAEYRLWRTRAPGQLTADEQRFVDTSQADETRSQRIRRALVTAAIAVLAIGVILQYRANQRAEEALTRYYEEQGRQALVDGNPSRSLVYLEEAYQRGADTQALRFMIARAAEAFDPVLMTLRGHSGGLFTVAFSPDGRHIATGGLGGEARLWHRDTGRLMRVLDGHDDKVIQIRFDPDGQRVVTASDDGVAIVWSVGTGALLHRLDDRSSKRLEDAVFSADGRVILTVGAGATIWNSDTGQAVTALVGHQGSVFHGEFDPTGARVLTAGADGTARLWDGQTGATLSVLEGHDSAVFIARFSRSGDRVLTTSLDRTGRIWDSATGETLATLRRHDHQITDGAFSRDGQRAVTVSRDGTAIVWDAGTGERRFTLRGHSGFVNRAAFFDDDRRIVTVSEDGTARIWDARRGVQLAILAGHDNFIYEQAIDPTGRFLATASWDGTARIWDLRPWRVPVLIDRTGHDRGVAAWSGDGDVLVTGGPDEPTVLRRAAAGDELATLPDEAANALQIAIDRTGSRIATVHARTEPGDPVLRVWRVEGGERPHRLAHIASSSGPITWLRFLDSARLLVLDDRGTVRSWQVDDDEPAIARALDGPADTSDTSDTPDTPDTPVQASLSRDSSLLALYSPDRSAVELWRAATLEPVMTLDGHEGDVRLVQISPDDRHAVSVSDTDDVRIWELATGRLLHRVRPGSRVTVARFGPLGRVLVTGSVAGNVHVWRVASGALLSRIESRGGYVPCLDISADGEFLLTGSRSGRARFWDLATRRELDSVVTQASRFDACELDRRGRRAFVRSADEVVVWNVAIDAHSRDDLADIVRCRVGQRLVDGRPVLAPRDRAGCRDHP